MPMRGKKSMTCISVSMYGVWSKVLLKQIHQVGYQHYFKEVSTCSFLS